MNEKALSALNRRKFPLILIFLILLSLFLVVIWFRDGKMYGGGDIGLPTYNPTLLVRVAQYTWWNAQGTGFSYPAVASTLPFYLLLSIPQFLGFSPLVIQMIFFFFVLSLSLTGSFLLVYLISKRLALSFFAAIFYLTNPYTLMNILHRFNHTGMIMMLYIPWTLIFLYMGLTRRKSWFALILAISSLFGAYAFGTPAFLATWWFLIISFWIFVSFIGGKKNLGYNLLFLLCFIFIWIGLNLWWLAPFLQTANIALSTTTTQSGNIDSLRGVSRFFSLPFAFRGINSFFLTEQKDWGVIYTNPFFNLLSWIGFGFILFSLFIKEKPRFFIFFLALFLITIFISKGSEVPLGNLIVIAFSASPILGVFRNPFEKFGILLPIYGSFLFAYGLEYFWFKLLIRFKKKIASVILVILLSAFFIVYPWPIWTGNIFGSFNNPAKFVVPKDYSKAQTWFQDQKAVNPVILHLPLALGDSAVYDWGYNGIELSPLFFPGYSISHYVGTSFLDLRYQEIAQAVKVRDKLLFKHLLSNFGVDYIVLHEDFEPNAYTYDRVVGIRDFLKNLPYVKFDNKIGKLDIYSIETDQPSYGRVYFSTNPTVLSGNLSYFDNWAVGDDSNPNIYISNQDQARNFRNDISIILPDGIINYPAASVSKENALNELPFVKYLPGDLMYNLVRIKEQLDLSAKNDEEKFKTKLDFSNKRLVETFGLLKRKDYKNAGVVLKEYLKDMNELMPVIKARVSTANFNNDVNALQTYQAFLLRQRTVLTENILSFGSNSVKDIIFQAINLTDQGIASTGLQPLYPNNLSFPNPVIRFNILTSGEYFLRLKKTTWEDLLSLNSQASILVDGKNEAFGIKKGSDSSFLEIGPYNLSEGEHEFAIRLTNQAQIDRDKVKIEISDSNLVSDLSDDLTGFNIQAKSDQTSMDYLLNKTDIDSFYEISFEYWTRSGLSPTLSVIEDVDGVKDGKIVPSFEKEETSDNYSFFWHPVTVDFKIDKLVTQMKIRISLEPWNNCLSIFVKNKSNCLNKGILNQYNRDSDVLIRNVSIRKIPTSGIVLIKNNSNGVAGINIVNSKRIDPTAYEVHLNATSSGVLVFRDSYHDLWFLNDSRGNKLENEHVLVDGYANGWIFPNSKEINLKLEFDPQNKEKVGFWIGSIITLIGIIMIALVKKNI